MLNSYLLAKPELIVQDNDIILSDTESVISSIEEEEDVGISPVQVKQVETPIKEDEDNITFQTYFKDILLDIGDNLVIEAYTKTSNLQDDEDWGWDDDLSITNTYYIPKFMVKLIEMNITNKKLYIIIMNVLLLKIYKMYEKQQFVELYRLLDYGIDNESGIINLVKDNIMMNMNNLINGVNHSDNVLVSVNALVGALPLDIKLVNQNDLLVFSLEMLTGRFSDEVSFLVKRKIIEWYKDNNKKMIEDVLVRLNEL